MKTLSLSQKILRSLFVITIMFLPLVFCLWLIAGDNAALKEIEHVLAVLILPIAFFLVCARLLCRAWK